MQRMPSYINKDEDVETKVQCQIQNAAKLSLQPRLHFVPLCQYLSQIVHRVMLCCVPSVLQCTDAILG